MTRPRPGAVLLLICAVGLLAFTSSGAYAGTTPPHTDDPAAVRALHRAALALDHTSYSGTRMVSVWGSDDTTTVVADIRHVAGQGTTVSVRGGGVGDDTAAFLAGGQGDTGRPGLGVESLTLLAEAYTLRDGGHGSVAGRTASIVEVVADRTTMARLWLDEATGLPLRREMFDQQGRLARESTFIDVRVQPGAFLAHLPPSTPSEPSAELVALDQLGTLRDRGWACPEHAGRLTLLSAERVDDPAALHLSYSDGLTRVSVFQQRGRLDTDGLTGFSATSVDGGSVYVREGLPSYAVWQSEGYVYTVVTDAPVDTALETVRALPHDHPSTDLRSRIGRGIARIAGWLAPL